MSLENSDLRSHALQVWDNLPESKLELIDGRLIAGNSLAGSQYLLWAILQTLGPRAALPLATLDKWWEALATTYRAPALLPSQAAWERWATQIDHEPRIASPGARFDWRHHEAYSLLMLGLYQAMREDEGIGRSIQRFGLRLGDDALMPDLQCFRRDRLHRLRTYFYEGPADVVIEIVLPGSEAQDMEVKRKLYAEGGVPEYWIIDPYARHIEFLWLTPEGYQPLDLDSSGLYRSTSMPGLACNPAQLWACLDDPNQRHGLGKGIFTVEPTDGILGDRTSSTDETDWSWEWRPFAPPVALRRTAIAFDQFIDWCLESKFEMIDGKPYIGSWEGTRNVLGLLLMTFGLEEVVTLLHPREWVAALLAEESARRHDAARRDSWWSLARQAVELLRERFGVERVAVVGDLARPEPLHLWSEITLVAWGLPDDWHAIYEALRELPDEPRLDVRAAEDASPQQQAAFATQAVML